MKAKCARCGFEYECECMLVHLCHPSAAIDVQKGGVYVVADRTWRLPECAPVGEDVLVCCDGVCHVARRYSETGAWFESCGGDFSGEPNWWMRLPQVPPSP